MNEDILAAVAGLHETMLDLKCRAQRLTDMIERRDKQIAEALAATKQLNESVQALVELSYERDQEFAAILEAQREDDPDNWWRG